MVPVPRYHGTSTGGEVPAWCSPATDGGAPPQAGGEVVERPPRLVERLRALLLVLCDARQGRITCRLELCDILLRDVSLPLKFLDEGAFRLTKDTR